MEALGELLIYETWGGDQCEPQPNLHTDNTTTPGPLEPFLWGPKKNAEGNVKVQPEGKQWRCQRCLFHLLLLPHFCIYVSKRPHTHKLDSIFNMHICYYSTSMLNMQRIWGTQSALPFSISSLRKDMLAVVVLAMRRMGNKFLFFFLNGQHHVLPVDWEVVRKCIFLNILVVCNVKCINSWVKFASKYGIKIWIPYLHLITSTL